MANHNQSRFLARALEAMLRQTYRPLEIVLVDDGSTDASVGIIESFLKNNPEIRFVRNETNEGSYEAYERGRGLITGEYYYGAACDDYVLPGFFEKAMAMAQRHPEAGVIMGQMAVHDASGRYLTLLGSRSWKEPLYAEPGRYLREYLEVETPLHALGAATVYRLDAARAVGGWRRELGSMKDTFLPRALGLRHGVCYLAEPGVVWTYRTDSVSQMTMAEPAKALEQVGRIKRLMLSAEFRDVFPEDYVRHWEREYRRFIFFYNRPWVRFLSAWSVRLLRVPVLGACVRLLEKMIRYGVYPLFSRRPARKTGMDGCGAAAVEEKQDSGNPESALRCGQTGKGN